MTERPILFSPPMVRALLEGRKTQTRRVLNPQPYSAESVVHVDATSGAWMSCEPSPATGGTRQMDPWRSLRFRIGDRLCVREAWRTFVSLNDDPPSQLLNGNRGAGLRFEADGRTLSVSRDGAVNYQHSADPVGLSAYGRLRAGMHLPRWGSRLTLDVTDVRVERLQDISDGDALAEGVQSLPEGRAMVSLSEDHAKVVFGTTPRGAYAGLWEAINGSGSWDANPWVVAIAFRVVDRETA